MTLLGSRVMAENQEIDLNAWQKLDLLQDEAKQMQSNPHLRVAVQALLSNNNLIPST